MSEPLVDRFGRIHRSLRISVTDRCNIRCQYCMSEGPIRFLQKSRLLSFEQIAQFVAITAPFGLSRIRLTGGEPLVRSELHKLVRLLKAIPQVQEIALTTNGILLADQIDDLLAAGLDRVNISLDTLREENFQRISRRDGIAEVIKGIEAAISRGMLPRLNALILRDINFSEAADLVNFALERQLSIRFIEFMPLDQDRKWEAEQVVSGAELRSVLEQHFGALVPIEREREAQPAHDFALPDRKGVVGFIDPVSHPFCSSCDRLRLTADGKLRNCLFGQEEWDVKQVLESGSTDEQLVSQVIQLIRTSLNAKHASHGISSSSFVVPERAMYQIGG